MNDYEEQLSGGTLPELTPEQQAELANEKRMLQGQLDSMQEVEQPEVPQVAATAAPVEAPPQQQTGPFRTETGDIE